jgi:methylthioribose-1-phosphate isomerase
MRSIEWHSGKVRFIDQTKLPLERVLVETDDYRVIEDAIRKLKIRGAPAIGVAAAFGILLGVYRLGDQDKPILAGEFEEISSALASTRPTAVNLFWAIERMSRVFSSNGHLSVGEIKSALLDEATSILDEDIEACRRIGEFGAALVPDNSTVLTHCHTGFLATGGDGTAANVIWTAVKQGRQVKVYADETRPLLQGARLTTWEFMEKGIDVTLITDNTAAFLMQRKMVNLVIVGADRIALNGDVANKIGTYSLAVLAKEHNIPFYVAAPVSTIDPNTSIGDDIPIEERNPEEVTEGFGRRIAPYGVRVYAPAFDVTPHHLVGAIITEEGILFPPFKERIDGILSKKKHRVA